MLRKIKNDQKQRLCKKISEIKPYYAYERKCNIIVILMRLKYESKSKIVKISSDGHEIFLNMAEISVLRISNIFFLRPTDG